MTESDAPFGARELTLTRVLDAPRELVWRAWTDPARMARWWGPKASTIRFARWTCGRAAISASTCERPTAPSIR